MDSYYSSPPSHCYYHHSPYPSYDSSASFASDPYADPYSSYAPAPANYYYPTYSEPTSSSPIVFYNNSTTNIYAPPTYATPQPTVQATPSASSTPSLNTTFESGMFQHGQLRLMCLAQLPRQVVVVGSERFSPKIKSICSIRCSRRISTPTFNYEKNFPNDWTYPKLVSR